MGSGALEQISAAGDVSRLLSVCDSLKLPLRYGEGRKKSYWLCASAAVCALLHVMRGRVERQRVGEGGRVSERARERGSALLLWNVRDASE